MLSIHALREEGDLAQINGINANIAFLSTPSARRATLIMTSKWDEQRAFYPRPPRGGRRFWIQTDELLYDFLSTPSARRATLCKLCKISDHALSIHALREEGDSASASSTSTAPQTFYPRPPRGGRLTKSMMARPRRSFYPRPPRGGRREPPRCGSPCGHLSIHALREEGDRMALPGLQSQGLSIHALREEGDSARPAV